MKKCLFLLLFFLSIGLYPLSGQESNVIYQPEDTVIFNRYIHIFASRKNLPTGELVIQTAEFFLKKPYVPRTLEVNAHSEKLVINLRQFDCTTFVESCLSLVRVLQHRQPSFKAFCEELKKIRYRDGELTDYSSRLHYFSDWITNNEKKGKVMNLTHEFGGVPFVIEANIMTSRPELYPAMKDLMVKYEMKKIEQNVSDRRYFRLPKELPANSRIRNGDILCLTTKGSGVGISHVGFALRQGEILYFLNASQTAQKVEISAVPFIQLISQREKTTGYMVVRPL